MNVLEFLNDNHLLVIFILGLFVSLFAKIIYALIISSSYEMAHLISNRMLFFRIFYVGVNLILLFVGINDYLRNKTLSLVNCTLVFISLSSVILNNHLSNSVLAYFRKLGSLNVSDTRTVWIISSIGLIMIVLSVGIYFARNF